MDEIGKDFEATKKGMMLGRGKDDKYINAVLEQQLRSYRDGRKHGEAKIKALEAENRCLFEQINGLQSEDDVSQCFWKEEDIETGVYNTGCGNTFYFDDGTTFPDSKIKYCMYCGKLINGLQGAEG